jgi:hypothetical protein
LAGEINIFFFMMVEKNKRKELVCALRFGRLKDDGGYRCRSAHTHTSGVVGKREIAELLGIT